MFQCLIHQTHSKLWNMAVFITLGDWIFGLSFPCMSYIYLRSGLSRFTSFGILHQLEMSQWWARIGCLKFSEHQIYPEIEDFWHWSYVDWHLFWNHNYILWDLISVCTILTTSDSYSNSNLIWWVPVEFEHFIYHI